MSDWYFDVDSGPVIKGYGFAACAFGAGAAKTNGHMEHAYPLTAEMASASWPLPGGLLLIPRLLSNATDAPYLGEAGVLYSLTRRPMNGISVSLGGSIPGFTWVIMGIQITLGTGLLAGIGFSVRKWWPRRSSLQAPLPRIQFMLWLALVAGSPVMLALGRLPSAALLLLSAQLLPCCVSSAPSESTRPGSFTR